MKVYLHAIGCRLNQSEVETMARQLLAAGHEIVTDPSQADKAIINSCAVTNEAARDSRNLTRRIHRNGENTTVFMTGCYATIAPQELEGLGGDTKVVANKDKDRLVNFLDPSAAIALPLYEQEPILRQFRAGSSSHTRAFIKVQDGCDNKCTFCITTVARGQGQSRHLGDIVSEIQSLASAGYQEAVLTGVHLGSYGRDLGNGSGKDSHLKELVNGILQHTDIPRLRISSLEPWDIPDGFFSLWENSRLLPHLHMPLQSGSDRILRRMARRTNQASFSALVDDARAHIADLNLSTDIIVGFPGETEQDFQESLDFVRRIGFSRLHVFSYSSRPGTAAATMANHLPKKIKKDRASRMIAFGEELSLAFHQQYEGITNGVLWESAVGADRHGLRWLGHTDNYIRVDAIGPADLSNKVTLVRFKEARSDGISGEIVGRS